MAQSTSGAEKERQCVMRAAEEHFSQSFLDVEVASARTSPARVRGLAEYEPLALCRPGPCRAHTRRNLPLIGLICGGPGSVLTVTSCAPSSAQKLRMHSSVRAATSLGLPSHGSMRSIS